MELSGECQFLHRGDTAEPHVGALVVVCPEPMGRCLLYLFDHVEQGLGQPAVADGAVVAFDVGVLLRLPGLDVIEFDPPCAWPMPSARH